GVALAAGRRGGDRSGRPPRGPHGRRPRGVRGRRSRRRLQPGSAPMTAWRWAGVLFAVFALRALVMLGSGASLHVDEAQYWDWSRSLAWGYFSKPPAVAALIAAATAVFGDGVFGVRALAVAVGLLDKYTTAALLPGAVFFAWRHGGVRALGACVLASALALAALAPNLLWNAQLGWPTLRHTADITVERSGAGFSLGALLA